MSLPKLGFLTWSDWKGPTAFSGSPWSARTALERIGHEVVDIDVGTFHNASRKIAHQHGSQAMANPRFRAMARKLLGPIVYGRLRTLQKAKAHSRTIDAAIQKAAPDVIVGVKMSRSIAYLQTDLPILYATDATASMLNEGYKTTDWKGSGWKKANYELESRALQRADATVLWFTALVERAIQDHGADPSRLHVANTGSNVQPPEGHQHRPRSIPQRDDLRILYVAADPIRKQISVAVDVVRTLRERGWNARLLYMGPDHPQAEAPEVERIGVLRLDDQADRKTHQMLLSTSHVNLLPSRADMTPVSVNEASMFGLPSVVSSVGGLPDQVLDRTTGRVLPWDAPASDWADAIEWVVESDERYGSLSTASHEHASSHFTWDAWGAKVSKIIQNLVRR